MSIFAIQTRWPVKVLWDTQAPGPYRIETTVFADLEFDDAWSKLGFFRRIFLHVLARTRFIDDTVTAELRDGATQVVVLGAGYDSRAYLMQNLLRAATVFKVDFPPLQQLKKLRVREVLHQVPKNVIYVPIDFTTEDLVTVLLKAGYRRDRKSVFRWEGVSMYLDEGGVDETLRFVARNSAPGSTIMFDYESDRAVRGDHSDEPLKQSMARLARWGEAQIFGLPIGRARAFVERCELTVDVVQQGAIAADQVERMGRQLADALDYAHEKGIIHRELKPANLNRCSHR